jgi:flagellar basal body P-ring protein FlgI
VCKEPAADCKNWSTHCLAVYKKAAKIVREESTSLVVQDNEVKITSTEANPVVVPLAEKTFEHDSEKAKVHDVKDETTSVTVEDQPAEVQDAATQSNTDNMVAELKSTFQEYL